MKSSTLNSITNNAVVAGAVEGMTPVQRREGMLGGVLDEQQRSRASDSHVKHVFNSETPEMGCELPPHISYPPRKAPQKRWPLG